MKIEEARKQINDAESKVNNAFSDMRRSAFDMDDATEAEAHKNTIKKTLIPLIACLIGFFSCVSDSWGSGIVLIIIGVVVSYKMHEGAILGEKKISNLAKDLSNQLNQYPKL